jgi:hypothetical protein
VQHYELENEIPLTKQKCYTFFILHKRNRIKNLLSSQAIYNFIKDITYTLKVNI